MLELPTTGTTHANMISQHNLRLHENLATAGLYLCGWKTTGQTASRPRKQRSTIATTSITNWAKKDKQKKTVKDKNKLN
eukprot:1619069-Amphidinium_carterae.1